MEKTRATSFYYSILNIFIAICIFGIFWVGGYDYWRWEFVACLFFVSLLTLLSPNDWPDVRFWNSGIFVFFITGLTSGISLNELDFYRFYELFQWTLFLLLLVPLGYFLKSQKTPLFLVILTGLVISGYGLYNIPYYSVWLIFEGGKLSNFIPVGFSNIRIWSNLATWFLPLAPVVTIYLKDHKKHRSFYGIYMAGVCAWWALVIVTTSRGSVVSMIITTVVFLAIFRTHFLYSAYFKELLKQALFGSVVWLISCLLLPLIFSTPEDPVLRDINFQTSGRIELFYEALMMSFHNFPLGMGPLSWLTHSPITEGGLYIDKVGSPHNMILLVAAEFGWLSAIGVTFSLGWFLNRLLRSINFLRSDGEEAFWKQAVSFSILAAVIHSMVSGIFIAAPSLLVGFWVLALGFSIILNDSTLCGSDHSGVGKWISRSVIVVLMLCLISSSYIYYQKMTEDKAALAEQGDFERMPRVWHHGGFPR